MRSPERRIGRYLDHLLRNIRPRRFKASPEELEAMRAAVRLLPTRPGADEGPDPAFVDRLQRRLRVDMEGVTPTGVSRRRLLGSAGALVAAVGAGAVTDHLLAAPDSQPPGELVPASGSWIPAAMTSSMADGQAVRFNTGSIAGFVVRKGDTYFAVSAVCTHLGCLLQDPGQGRLSCPCHRTTFSLEGQVLVHQLPRTPPSLPRLRTRVREGVVEVFAV
ncbi:MAG: Rieske 2Fe-2S domain-containing protein [Actinobacteria bacterium]|nr:Rieske 2Fe-2S domain-containing protein [Actinomycetota bacterium]